MSGTDTRVSTYFTFIPFQMEHDVLLFRCNDGCIEGKMMVDHSFRKRGTNNFLIGIFE